MAMIYHKPLKVPLWVVVKKSQKAKQISKWFTDRDAKAVEWPALTYKDTVTEFSNKGWLHVFHEPRVVLPPDFVILTAKEHIKKTMSPLSQLVFDISVAKLNRVINNDDDYVNLFNSILKSQPRLNLCQSFQIGELCHNDESKNYKVFVSIDPCDKSVLTELATKVITIGKGVECDINLEKADKDKLEDFLEQEIVNFI